MGRDKTYLATMQLHADVTREQLESHMQHFIGEITQLPPVRSRVKRQERQRIIHRFHLLELDGRDAVCLVECQAGTYVRKLVHDMGLEIGGAHMAGLRRTRAGIFSEKDAEFATPDAIAEAAHSFRQGDDTQLRRLLIPGEAIARILPVLEARPESVDKLLHGLPMETTDLTDEASLPADGESAAVFCAGRFIEVAKVAREGDTIVARAEFVLV
jgi:H/ACA ribonucleoprotein complex subunit 4